jgi:hypothetical protein
MQTGLPVFRDPSFRSGRGLVLWMPARRSKLRPTDHLLSLIAPEPGFAGLKAGRDRMSRRVKVLRGMLTGRAVTTADMSALRATAQVQPPSIGSQTFGATCPARFSSRINGRMIGFGFHCSLYDALTSRLISLIVRRACQPCDIDGHQSKATKSWQIAWRGFQVIPCESKREQPSANALTRPRRMARPRMGAMEGYGRHSAHVHADCRQDASGTYASSKSLVERALVRDGTRTVDIRSSGWRRSFAGH